jgi:peptidoglycan pentaglycine glycine transferase (the first glycine)
MNNWNSLITNLPTPHFLQTVEWAQVKAAGGWQPLYVVWLDKSDKSNRSGRSNTSGVFTLPNGGCWTDRPDLFDISDQSDISASALVLKRTVLSGGFAAKLCILYCPKGPNLDWSNAPLRQRVLDDLQQLARQHGAIFLKLDPDVVLGTGVPGADDAGTEPGGEAVRADLALRGWRFSQDQLQFRNTVMLDVSPSEEEMLARMKQKTRYNVRLAMKKDVRVRVGSEADFAMLYQIYAETAARDGFIIREERYYQTVWKTFSPSTVYGLPSAQPLIAEVDGELVAAVFLFAFAERAYYVYGMSRDAHREKMPTYLLQWEAMLWAKAHGCKLYDLWGAPDVFDESDSMWGVFRFKEGLGGYVVRTLGAWDFAPNPLWYALYTQVMPKVLDWMRKQNKVKLQSSN